MNVKRIIPIGAIVAFAVYALYCVWCFVMMLPPDTDALRVHLLCETDHAALLDACRGLSRRAAAGELKPKTYHFAPTVDPETATFGSPILELEPVYVNIDESGMIVVAMIGGLDHIGVYAYPENFSRQACAVRGDRELMPGLWYYDDGYTERPQDWDKHIEKLRPAPRPSLPGGS